MKSEPENIEYQTLIKWIQYYQYYWFPLQTKGQRCWSEGLVDDEMRYLEEAV